MHPCRWLTGTLARVVARVRARRRPSAPTVAPTPDGTPPARESAWHVPRAELEWEGPYPRSLMAEFEARLDEDVRRIAAATRLPPCREPDGYLAAPVRDGRASWPDASPVSPMRGESTPREVLDRIAADIGMAVTADEDTGDYRLTRLPTPDNSPENGN